MKAKVQYDDYKGTVAADISDYYLNSLNDYLKQKYPLCDWDRYYCIGCKLYTSYGQYPSVYFICRDIFDSKYYLFRPEKEYTLEHFFELFKRFSIVLGESNIDEIDVEDNTIIIKESNNEEDS